MSDKNVKKQIGGDSSLQVQSDTFNQQINNNYYISNGVTEAQVIKIFKEQAEIIIQEYGIIAEEKANERINKFENITLEKIHNLEVSLDAFKKPELRVFVSECYKSAVQTDLDSDYDVLSELLLERIKNDGNRVVYSSLKYATQIIPDLDSSALLSLTVYYCAYNLMAEAIKPLEVIRRLDELYKNILYDKLPEKSNWIEQLEILRCIKTQQFYMPLSYIEHFKKTYSAFFEIGIKENSDNYFKATEILSENQIPRAIFGPHEFNPGYYKLNIARESDIDNRILFKTILGNSIMPTEAQKDALHTIYKLYESSSTLKTTISKKIEDTLKTYPYINSIISWLDKIKINFSITSVGNLIANANSRIYEKRIPKLKMDNEENDNA